MTIRVMAEGERAEGGAGRVTLIADLSGPGSDATQLGVRSVSGGTWQDPAYSQSAAGRREIVVPAVDEPLEVVVRLPGEHPEGTAFRHGTTGELRIEVLDTAADRGDVFIRRPVNLSGLRSVVLATLAPAGPGLAVAVPEVASIVDDPGVEPDLDGLAGAAITVARRVVGHRTHLPRERTRSVRLVLDRSASMLPHVRSGLVADLIAAFSGVNAVVGSGALAVDAVSTVREPVHRQAIPTGPVDAAAAVATAYSRVDTGFEIAHLVGLLGDDPVVVYVVTDALPPDLGELVADRTAADAGPADVCWHVILLGETALGVGSGRHRRGRADPDRLPIASDHLSITTLTAPLRPAGAAGPGGSSLDDLVTWALAWSSRSA